MEFHQVEAFQTGQQCTDSNLELSIALSLISNILSFGLMPMWLALYPYLSPDPSDDGIRLSFHMTYTV